MVDDYDSYFADLSKNTAEHLENHKGQRNFQIFKCLYPLFVLLETLQSPGYFLDPSKQIELEQALEIGDKAEITKASRKLFTASISKLLREGLKKRYSTPNLNELYSDVFLLLNQYYLNNYRACYISLRCILEDLYRHIYYLDHSQEFQSLKLGKSKGAVEISPRFLKKYLERVSQLAPFKEYDIKFEKLDAEKRANEVNKNTIFHLNNELYRETSAFVHCSDPDLMSGFASNADLIFNREVSEELTRTTKKVANLSVIFLVCMHFNQFLQFNEYEKSLVFSGFELPQKGNLRRLLGI